MNVVIRERELGKNILSSRHDVANALFRYCCVYNTVRAHPDRIAYAKFPKSSGRTRITSPWWTQWPGRCCVWQTICPFRAHSVCPVRRDEHCSEEERERVEKKRRNGSYFRITRQRSCRVFGVSFSNTANARLRRFNCLWQEKEKKK